MTRPSSHYSPFSDPAQGDTDRAADARLRAAQGRYEATLERYGNAAKLAAHPEVTDLTAEQVNAMSMQEFARLRERAGLVTPAPTYTADSAPTGAPAQVPRGQYIEDVPDFSQLSMADYVALRAHYIRPSSTARGIFD